MVCPRGGGGGLRSPVCFPLFFVSRRGVFQSLTSLTDRGLDGTHTKPPSSFGHDSLRLCFLTGTGLRGSWNSLSFVKHETGLHN